MNAQINKRENTRNQQHSRMNKIRGHENDDGAVHEEERGRRHVHKSERKTKRRRIKENPCPRGLHVRGSIKEKAAILDR